MGQDHSRQKDPSGVTAVYEMSFDDSQSLLSALEADVRRHAVFADSLRLASFLRPLLEIAGAARGLDAPVHYAVETDVSLAQAHALHAQARLSGSAATQAIGASRR